MSNKERKWLLEEKYDNVESPQYEEDLKRLEEGEPLDYIIGYKDFLGAKIDLSFKPLIPRVETEYWVEKVIKTIPPSSSPIKVLDIFSGSGCIGIGILSKLANSQVTLSDISPDNIAQINKNLEMNNIEKARYTVLESDVFKNVAGKFNYIFANPPYISLRAGNVDKEVLEHEPNVALFSEDEGLYHIEATLGEAPKYLEEGGKLFIEIGSDQKEKVENIISSKFESIYKSFKVHEDQYGRPRYIELSV